MLSLRATVSSSRYSFRETNHRCLNQKARQIGVKLGQCQYNGKTCGRAERHNAEKICIYKKKMQHCFSSEALVLVSINVQQVVMKKVHDKDRYLKFKIS